MGALHPPEAAQLRGGRRHREALPRRRRVGLLDGDAPEERHTVLAGQGQRAVAQVGRCATHDDTFVLGWVIPNVGFTQSFKLFNKCLTTRQPLRGFGVN